MSLAVGLSLVWAAPAAAQTLDFVLPTVDGQPLRLADFRGRTVVLDFFATWCRPCKKNIPHLKALQKRYGGQGVSVIGYSLDAKGANVVRPFIVDYELNFPVVLGNARQAKRLAGVGVVPTTLVLDPRGQVVERYEGVISEGHLEAVVRPYLNRRAPAPPALANGGLVKPTRRLSRVWVTPNFVLDGQVGFLVNVTADLRDLAAESGLWIGLHMRPEARVGRRLIPLSEPTKLYQQVDDNNQEVYILFVTCQQLPSVPDDGVYRAWVSLFGPNLKLLDRTGEFLLTHPNETICRAR
jgi:peroxiredoxin